MARLRSRGVRSQLPLESPQQCGVARRRFARIELDARTGDIQETGSANTVLANRVSRMPHWIARTCLQTRHSNAFIDATCDLHDMRGTDEMRLVFAGPEIALEDHTRSRTNQLAGQRKEDSEAGVAQAARVSAIRGPEHLEQSLFDGVLGENRHAEMPGGLLRQLRLARPGKTGDEDQGGWLKSVQWWTPEDQVIFRV